MTRIYIAGPMSGLPDLNSPAFNAMAERLRAHGHHVENPAENPPPKCERSSPRPWGCFHRRPAALRRARVFPTPVGVFPSYFEAQARARSLPHARGGVSARSIRRMGISGSSPRPWGCFHVGTGLQHAVAVFPTPVGVFPAAPEGHRPDRSLPHARGGVSTRLGKPYMPQVSSPRPWGCFRSVAGL